MSYTALYRKYRPSTFDEVAGQQHVVTTLKNALEQNRLAHAYLFSGPSGNGKTSIAKLFAKAINCESETEIICDKCPNCLDTKNNTHPDVVEIDAASNNGVDEIRSLIEKVKYSPLNGKYKIYIIDEVHMLSLGAFNALLKTLEEPPAHVVFILATTEPHKVIPTILSRCQRYDFTRVKEEDIFNNIAKVLKNEGISYEDEAIQLISELADGGVRESLSILEQTIAYSMDNIKAEDVRNIYGIVTKEEKLTLLNLILEKRIEDTLNLLNDISDQGNNLERLNLDLIRYLKESVIYGYSESDNLLTILSKEDVEVILSKSTPTLLLEMIDILMDIASYKKTISDLHAYLELGFIKMINLSANSGIDIKEFVKLEKTSQPTHSNNNVKDNSMNQPASMDDNPVENESLVQEEEKTHSEETNELSEPEKVKEENINETAENSEVEDVHEETTIESDDELEEPQLVFDEAIDDELGDSLVIEEDIITEMVVEDDFEDFEEEIDEVEAVKEVIEEVEVKEEVLEEIIDSEYLLALLANADKEKRLVMDQKWASIERFASDVKHAKHAHQLRDSALIAVGSNYALVSVANEMFANNINDLDNQSGLSEFIKEKLDEELRVFAISVDEGKSLIDKFKIRAAQGSLPAARVVNIIKKEAEANSKATLESKAEELFGENNFIIEE